MLFFRLLFRCHFTDDCFQYGGIVVFNMVEFVSSWHTLFIQVSRPELVTLLKKVICKVYSHVFRSLYFVCVVLLLPCCSTFLNNIILYFLCHFISIPLYTPSVSSNCIAAVSLFLLKEEEQIKEKKECHEMRLKEITKSSSLDLDEYEGEENLKEEEKILSLIYL